MAPAKKKTTGLQCSKKEKAGLLDSMALGMREVGKLVEGKGWRAYVRNPYCNNVNNCILC